MDVSEEERYYYWLINLGISVDVLNYAIDVDGYNMETLNSVLFWATGYRTREQFEESELGL